jgi:hypothetical protein
MQNSQDFRLQIATLTTGNEKLPHRLCAPRGLVTVSQKCRFGPTINQEKTLRKSVARSSVRGVLSGERTTGRSENRRNVKTAQGHSAKAAIHAGSFIACDIV